MAKKAPILEAKDKGPNIPSGLDLRYIRKAEDIPNAYIKKHFVIEEFREAKSKVVNGMPLFKTIIEQLTKRQLTENTGDSRYYEDESEEEKEIDGHSFPLSDLLRLLKDIVDSEATLSLFKSVKVYYHEEESFKPTSCPVRINYGWNEIVLCNEETTYESDAVVIDKIKRKVFSEISRYRRAKKKY